MKDLVFCARSMYVERQDDACTATVFRLYLALLVSDSGSGGLFRAYLKDWKQQDFQIVRKIHTSRSPQGCGF